MENAKRGEHFPKKGMNIVIESDILSLRSAYATILIDAYTNGKFS